VGDPAGQGPQGTQALGLPELPFPVGLERGIFQPEDHEGLFRVAGSRRSQRALEGRGPPGGELQVQPTGPGLPCPHLVEGRREVLTGSRFPQKVGQGRGGPPSEGRQDRLDKGVVGIEQDPVLGPEDGHQVLHLIQGRRQD
jgi:hypothetical protein